MKNKITILLTLVLLLLNYNRIYSQTKSVWVDQKSFFDNVSIDSVGHYNIGQNRFDKYKAPQNFTWNIGSSQTLLGSQKLLDGQKYKYWTYEFQEVSNVINHQSFPIYSWTNNLTSKFHLTNPGITIKTSLEGLDLTGGVIEFKDPWFIDYQDTQYAYQLRNRGMNEAYPHPRTSPFYPNSTTPYNGLYYNGVFLDQNPATTPTYYKVGVPQEQTISVHGQSRSFYFNTWEASIINNLPSAQFQDEYSQETGVVFKDQNAIVKANLKGQLMSNSTNGISSASQRKIVRTDNGRYHIVYESSGSVYYTFSLTSAFAGSWQKDKILETNEIYFPVGKNPSMDYYGNIVSIVFEYLEESNVYIYYMEVDAQTGDTIYTTSFLISNSVLDYGNVKPVVSSHSHQRAIIYKSNSLSPLKYRIRSLNVSTNNWIWNDSEKTVRYSDKYSVNPSVVGNKNLLEHHIVWQQNNSSIKYVHADYDSYDTLRFCQYRDVSENSGFSTNQNPSVSVSYDIPQHKVQVSWQGIYKTVLEKGTKKVQDYSLYRYEAVTRLKVGEDSWGTKRNFGSFVNYVQSGSLNSTNGAVIAWCESNGNYTKYVKRRTDTNYDPTESLSTNGLYALVSNGSTFENLKASVFNTLTSSPYLIKNCNNDFSEEFLDKLNSNGSIDLTYGRSGVIGKNGIQFLFNIGDVLLNDESIKFIERNDTLPITSVNQLNESARTNNFYLNSQSELMFSNFYYVVNKNLADSSLTNEFSLNFKCELVNASTNNVVGTFDNVTYNKFNVQEYANPSYLIDCDGIEAGDYYLRLFSTVNEDVKFSISEIQRDDVTLEKQNFIRRNFKGEIVLPDYNLAQNFPNPFNPSTKIRYQIPIAGIVTLKIYDILGREVATLVNEEKNASKYEVNFNASALSSGVYIYKIQAESFFSSKKMLLIK